MTGSARLALLGALGCLIAASSVRAAVICVPASFDVSCTSSQPTIQQGIDAAAPGDTVFVAPGTYPETVTAGHGGVVAGTAGIDIDKSLTLKSSGGKAVTTITNGGSPPGGHCLPTSCPGGPVSLVTLSSSAVTIDGFTILEGDSTVNLITADGDADSKNHAIKNNHITNPTFDDGNNGGGWGILLGGTAVSGADNNSITDNEIDLNPDPTKNQFTFGIGFSGGAADSNDNNLVSGNSLHDMGFGGFGDKNDTNTTVSGNTFMNLAKVGWQDFGSASGEMITGNSVSNAGRAGIEVRNGAQNVRIEDNCFSLNGSSPTTFSPCPFGGCTVTPFGAIRIEDDGASPATMGTKIHNNNFAGSDVPHGVTDTTAASTSTDGEADNDWWGCAAGPGNAACDSVTANVDFTPFLSSPASGTPCTPPPTTTTTTTTTTSTTTTTLPLQLTRLRIRRETRVGAGNGSILAKGFFFTPPAFTFPPPFSVQIMDSPPGATNKSHTFTNCRSTSGRVRCRDLAPNGLFRARFIPLGSSSSTIQFNVSFVRQNAIDPPFGPPVTMTLLHNGTVVRHGSISECNASPSGLSCRQP